MLKTCVSDLYARYSLSLRELKYDTNIVEATKLSIANLKNTVTCEAYQVLFAAMRFASKATVGSRHSVHLDGSFLYLIARFEEEFDALVDAERSHVIRREACIVSVTLYRLRTESHSRPTYMVRESYRGARRCASARWPVFRRCLTIKSKRSAQCSLGPACARWNNCGRRSARVLTGM